MIDSIDIQTDAFALKEAFTIARGTRIKADVITVSITRNGITGWGESVPYARYGETLDSVKAQISTLPIHISHADLATALPAGAARNAVDCALWDLAAKTTNRRAWELADLPKPKPQITAYTLSLDRPEKMRAAAQNNAYRPLLKVKLGGHHGDIERIKAVRQGAPKSRIIVDANEGWDLAQYNILAPIFVDLGVEMVEQPFPANNDDALLNLERILPVCADESCHDRTDLPKLFGKYDMINIKLDKSGGLSEALALKTTALAEGFDIMVGCMIGSSLAMAPAVLVAQGVNIVDLDGPLLLADDRAQALKYDSLGVHPPPPQLWG